MKTLITLIILFLNVNFLSAQINADVYYVKSPNNRVSIIDSADFIREVDKEKNNENLYSVFEFYKDKTKKSIGNSLTNTFNPKYNGNVIRYYKNGVKEST